MIATASSLHPLGAPLPNAELSFTLQNAARAGQGVLVECIYRPYRERDVRKKRFLHLLDSPFRIGRDLLSVQREEFHATMPDVRAAADATVTVTVPLLDPDADHRGYQLASVRIGDLLFERWFAEKPALDTGFGLTCTAERLHGTVRVSGLGARPLSGKLPLWPTLRVVEVAIAPVALPVTCIWDPSKKHNWDGWRTSIPEYWPGGCSIVARHIAGTAVWRAHEYFAIQSPEAPVSERSGPPNGVLPGIALEIFWPEGNTIEFPEMHFSRPPLVAGFPLARLTPGVRSLLARQVEPRPGIEANSMSIAEWKEFEALVDEAVADPADFSMQKAGDGKEVMTAKRLTLTEPWLYVFGVEYDSDRRVTVNSMVLNPERWSGPLPD